MDVDGGENPSGVIMRMNRGALGNVFVIWFLKNIVKVFW